MGVCCVAHPSSKITISTEVFLEETSKGNIEDTSASLKKTNDSFNGNDRSFSAKSLKKVEGPILKKLLQKKSSSNVLVIPQISIA